jgi:putative ABC transport system permease protein
MKFVANLPMALETLNRNKFLSLLTTLGIVIGIGAVVFTISLGGSISTFVSHELDRFVGATIFSIERPSHILHESGDRWTENPFQENLWLDEMNAIVRNCPSIKNASGLSFAFGIKMSHQGKSRDGGIIGTTPSLRQVWNWEPASGRFISADDMDQAARVCVLGKDASRHLFGNSNPIGEEVRIDVDSGMARYIGAGDTSLKVRFTVVGVLEEKGTAYTKQMGWPIDELVLLPATTLTIYFGKRFFQNLMLMAHAHEISRVPQAEVEVKLMLRRLFGDQNVRYFKVHSAVREQNKIDTVSRIIQLVLGFTASISLFVGGIGTMNIMLVSVTQRTPEFGLRMAIGATSNDIRFQLLLESVSLCIIGGIIGIMLAGTISLATSWAISTFLVKDGSWPFAISFQSALAAFLVSTTVGLCSGFYPAHKAASLQPTEAMRFE